MEPNNSSLENQPNQSQPTPPHQPPAPEPTIKQTGFLLPIIGVILLVALVGAGAYYLGVKKNQTETLSQKPTSMPIATPTTYQAISPDETTNWKNYNNPKLNITVKYPSDLFVEESETYAVFSFEPYPTGDFQRVPDNIQISLKGNYISGPFNALFKANQGEDVPEAHNAVDVKVTKIKNLKLGEFEAVEYIRDGLTLQGNSGLGRGLIGYEHHLLIKKNNQEFIDFINQNMEVEKTKQRDVIFNKMISSLSIR